MAERNRSTERANFRSLDVCSTGGAVAKVLALPAADVEYVLSERPQLAPAPPQDPQFGLTLILNRQPDPSEESVHSLIHGGRLVMDLEVGVRPAVLAALAENHQGKFQALYARLTKYRVCWNDGGQSTLLGEGDGVGSNGRGTVSAGLDRDQTLDVLDALEERSSRIQVSATVDYHATDDPVSVCLSGRWAAIYDYLFARCRDADGVTEATLYHLALDMVRESVIVVSTTADGQPVELPDDQFLTLFMRQASVVVRGPSRKDGVTWFEFRGRPHESFRLHLTATVTVAGLRQVVCNAALDQIIGGVLKGRDWDQHVRLVAQLPDDRTALTSVPRRVRAQRPRADRREVSGPGSLAVHRGAIMSLAQISRPQPSAAFIPPVILAKPRPSMELPPLDDLRILLPHVGARSLPLVSDPTAPYWPDRQSSEKVWYAPEFEVVEPAAADTPTSSPYLFSFERVGATASGQPALGGTVRFTLRQVMSERTATALRRDGFGTAKSVDMGMISVFLSLPFVDENNGRLRYHSLSGNVQRVGENLIITVSMVHDWVRLGYGALAFQGFQQSPPRLRILYAFSAYLIVQKDDMRLAYGGKAHYTPVVYSLEEAAKLKNTTFLDAATLTYVRPNGSWRFEQEKKGPANRQDRRQTAVALARPVVGTTTTLVSTPTIVHPDLTVVPEVAKLLAEVEYGVRTQFKNQTIDVVFPCSRFGRFYQEGSGAAATAIGCRDALTLGRIEYRLYEEIAALRTSDYSVHRSLQQPGIFLVVPARYFITRRAAGEPDAYRPLIFLNALLDPEVAANNRVELRVALQPDLPTYQRAELLDKLKAYDVAPTMTFPVEVPSQSVTAAWSLASQLDASIQIDAADPSGPFVSAYFGMDLASWQLMRTLLQNPGISGTLSVQFPDGSPPVHSALLLKLDRVRGPWQSGPLEVSVAGDRFCLTNRVDQAIEVDDLVRYAGSSIAQRVAVETRLQPQQSHTVSASGLLTPVYSYLPSDGVTIEEVRSFVEEIYSNIVFINLLNFANYGLLRLDIEARVRDVAGTHRAQLDETLRVADIPIVLPLTTYLEQRVLEFRVTKLFQDREPETTSWLTWDLDVRVVVSLTSELLDL